MSTEASPAPRVSARDIVAGLRALGVEQGARLFVHSSLRALGRVEGGAGAVCGALLEAAGESGTVAVPTFTWPSYHDREVVTFDVAHDPSEVGLVTETFRLLPGAVRSEHVCHSVAAIGPRAGGLMGEAVLPFGRGSSMHCLYEQDFHCLFIGCGFEACTALHTAEELAGVPYRYSRSFAGSTVIRADGTRVPSRAREYLRYVPFRNDFRKMEGIYRGRGVLREGRIGAARVLLAPLKHIVDICLELLRADAGFLLTEPSREMLKGWSGP